MRGRIAVVTGASRLQGIGAAIALALADAGMDIFFTYWRGYDRQMPWGVGDDEPEKLRRGILAKGVRCESLELDLSKADAAERLIDRVHDVLGPPDCLVNNATYSTYTRYTDLTAEELDRHYTVNLRSAAMLCVHFARRYDKAHRGKIVNLSSGQFNGPMPGELAYAATKGAMDAMTITLADELAERNITVNSVNPGCTDSGWMTDAQKEEIRTRFPLGRIGVPEDAAKLIRFLVSPEGDWVTGQLLHSDGGFRN